MVNPLHIFQTNCGGSTCVFFMTRLRAHPGKPVFASKVKSGKSCGAAPDDSWRLLRVALTLYRAGNRFVVLENRMNLMWAQSAEPARISGVFVDRSKAVNFLGLN